MNHSVAHKETAEPQKIDGQNAAVVEKKSEELEDSKFDLGGYENPYQYLKQFLRTTDETAADKLAEAVMGSLTGQGQEKLLKSLIEHACCSFDKKISATADMNDLKKDLKPGEYPYVNGYNRDLYNKHNGHRSFLSARPPSGRNVSSRQRHGPAHGNSSCPCGMQA